MKLAALLINEEERLADLISLNLSEKTNKQQFDKVLMILSGVTYSKVKDWVISIGNIRAKVKGINEPINIYDILN